MYWSIKPEQKIRDDCRCLCCWEFTGRWMVDSRDAAEGPFVIGTKKEAASLAEYLNELENE